MPAFRGLPWRRKRLTDAEYVEAIRKELQRSRRVGKWLIAFNAVMGVACVYLVVRLIQAVCGLAINPQQGNFVVLGLVFGGFMGLILGSAAHRIGESVGRAIVMFQGDRRDLLLLKYHDLLQEQGYLDEPSQEEPVTSNP